MKFGRKQHVEQEATADPASVAPDPGPLDISSVDDIEALSGTHVDLGSLLIAPLEGSELRMQVDEASGEILSVLLIGEAGAMEVRAFAAPRTPGLWADTRKEIAAEVARHGGTADTRDGAFGPELFVQQPVTMDDGQQGVQPSRVIGHEGPRWFLRATLLGQPAMEPETAGPWEDAIRAVVVRRGTDAMPPGEALPLTLPPQAQKVE